MYIINFKSKTKKNFFVIFRRYKKYILFCILFFIILNQNYFCGYNIDKFYKINNEEKKAFSIKVCLCAICKKENLYIKEFIEHYKKLGYKHIFLYDNNDINSEKIDTILQREINSGFVSIINYRGDNKSPQLRVYRDCYSKNSKVYDWISFFDIDEFLELKPNNIKIDKFLDNERYKYCQNIKFNWVIFSDNDKLYYENKPVQERFKKPLFDNPLNKHVKSTVRGNLSINYWNGRANPHTGVNNYNCCNPSGKQISKVSPFNEPYDYKYGYIKHYITKTIEEYIIKMKKGRADMTGLSFQHRFNVFFLINKKTEEKLKLFKKELNINSKEVLIRIIITSINK